MPTQALVIDAELLGGRAQQLILRRVESDPLVLVLRLGAVAADQPDPVGLLEPHLQITEAPPRQHRDRDARLGGERGERFRRSGCQPHGRRIVVQLDERAVEVGGDEQPSSACRGAEVIAHLVLVVPSTRRCR